MLYATDMLGGDNSFFPLPGVQTTPSVGPLSHDAYVSAYGGLVFDALTTYVDNVTTNPRTYGHRSLVFGIGSSLTWDNTVSGTTHLLAYSTEANIPTTITFASFGTLPSGSAKISQVNVWWSPVVSRYLVFVIFNNGIGQNCGHWVASLNPSVSGGAPTLLGSRAATGGNTYTLDDVIGDGARFISVSPYDAYFNADPRGHNGPDGPNLTGDPFDGYTAMPHYGVLNPMRPVALGASRLLTAMIHPILDGVTNVALLADQPVGSTALNVTRKVLMPPDGVPFKFVTNACQVGNGLALIDMDKRVSWFPNLF